MNPDVDEVLARDLAEYAADVFVERGGMGRVDHAIILVLPTFNAGKTEDANDDEKGRALGLARRLLGVKVEPDGTEIHPDGSHRKSDKQIVRELFGRTTR